MAARGLWSRLSGVCDRFGAALDPRSARGEGPHGPIFCFHVPMSEGLGGLPSVLTAYFSAINAGDISGAVEFVSPDATVSIRDTLHGTLEGSGPEAFAAWLDQAMSSGAVTVVPLSAERRDESVSVELAVSVFRPASGAVTLLQQIDYTIDRDRITAARAFGVRHVRLPGVTTPVLGEDTRRGA